MPSERAAILIGPNAGYELLFHEIAAKIQDGTWSQGHKIPSERELCERYGVSRTMVRQALLKAERHGLIVRIPGSGTFVRRPRIRQALDHMETFTETLREHSFRPGRRILHVGWEAADAEIAGRLGLPVGARVLAVDSLGLADDYACAIYQAHLATEIGLQIEPVLEEASETARATYELAAEILDVDELKVDQVFEAVLADVDTASRLSIPVGSPVFRVTSVFRLPNQSPIETRIALYRGDLYSFNIERELRLPLVAKRSARVRTRERPQ